MGKFTRFIHDTGIICAWWIVSVFAMLSFTIGLASAIEMWEADNIVEIYEHGSVTLGSGVVVLVCLFVFRYLWNLYEQSLDNEDDIV